jgi:Domain of unknown function (DUF222)
MFEQLGQAIEGLNIPADSSALAAVRALRDRLDARISSAVAAHDRAGLWELDGATSMTAWLADRASMPQPRAAATAVRARKLAQLPATAGAWHDGVLSSGQVEAIATNLDADTVGLFADHESAMLPTLVDLPVGDVTTAMRAWREAATAHRDPQPGPPHGLPPGRVRQSHPHRVSKVLEGSPAQLSTLPGARVCACPPPPGAPPAMPRRPLSVCTRPGCAGLAPNGGRTGGGRSRGGALRTSWSQDGLNHHEFSGRWSLRADGHVLMGRKRLVELLHDNAVDGDRDALEDRDARARLAVERYDVAGTRL